MNVMAGAVQSKEKIMEIEYIPIMPPKFQGDLAEYDRRIKEYRMYQEGLIELESHPRRSKSKLKAFKKGKACHCGATTNLDVHHKDGNPRNNEQSNLEVLCSEHHADRHPRLPRRLFMTNTFSPGRPKVFRVRLT
jgi:5-methylcytosine-specific restriction endonuclease McrA